METRQQSIYDHPKYYDLVFGSDCAAELRFIRQCAAMYCLGTAKRMFEPACGTGRLLFHLARKGFTVGGVDLNTQAVQFCNQRLTRHGIADRVFVGDMSAFELAPQADVAFNTINSFRHLTSERAARAHLNCMAAAVRPGGIYLLGIHLTPTTAPPSDTESWAARRGALAITTRMWTNARDAKTRLERFGIEFIVETPKRQLRIADELVLRSYTDLQMQRLLGHCGHWQIVGTYDFAYDITHPIEVDSSTEDVVYVLRRQAKPIRSPPV